MHPPTTWAASSPFGFSMTSWRATRTIGHQSDFASPRVVMVSSVGYQENIVAALQRGARHFVQKPVKPEVLYEVIKYVLGEDGAMVSAAGAGA